MAYSNAPVVPAIQHTPGDMCVPSGGVGPDMFELSVNIMLKLMFTFMTA